MTKTRSFQATFAFTFSPWPTCFVLGYCK